MDVFRRRPPNGVGVWNARWYKEITIFDQYRFISELMQDRAIVTMEGEQETVPNLSNSTSLNNLQ